MATWRLNRMNLPTQREQNSRWRPYNGTNTTWELDKYTIEVLTLADGHRKIVARGGASPAMWRQRAGGPLTLRQQATLFAIPFDPDSWRLTGQPCPWWTMWPITDRSGPVNSTSPGARRHGTLVYRRASGSASATMTLQWVDPTGKKEPLPAKPGVYRYTSLSPDGSKVALPVAEAGNIDIWVYDLRRDAMTRSTFAAQMLDRRGARTANTWSSRRTAMGFFRLARTGPASRKR